MINIEKLPVDILLKCLTYDKETGLLYHNPARPIETFASKRGYARWLTRFSGKPLQSKTKAGYIKITLSVDGCIYTGSAHRVIWFLESGFWPKYTIDHINGDRADNRVSNLRDVEHSVNCRNQKRKKNNSGYMGVWYRAEMGKYRATIYVDGRTKHLGYFPTLDDAISARVSAQETEGYHQNHGAR